MSFLDLSMKDWEVHSIRYKRCQPPTIYRRSNIPNSVLHIQYLTLLIAQILFYFKIKKILCLPYFLQKKATQIMCGYEVK